MRAPKARAKIITVKHFIEGLREFEPYIYMNQNICISEMKVASIMTQSRGHIMYSGRVLNTSLIINI